MSHTFKVAAVAALVFLSGWAAPAGAIAPHQPPAPERIASGEIRLPSLRVDSDALEVNAALIGAAQRDSLLQSRIAPFLARHGQDWEVRWDARGDRAAVVQGAGIPLIAGRGNALDAASFGLSGDPTQDLAQVAARARAFIDTVPELLAADRLELELDRERSVAFGPGNTRWFLEFQQQIEGVPVEGAFLYVRIVQGNVVQFGAERVAEPAAPLRASAAPAAEALFARVWDALGFAPDTRIGEWLDRGSLRVYPMLPAGEAPAMAFEGLRGSGYAHRLLRRYVFRVDAHATWQVLADAHSGEVVDLRDLTVHADATVSGDVYPTTNTDPLVTVPFPFAAVGNNGAKVTDIDGVYDYSGGTATVTLDGQYFRMADACGAISLSSTTDGNLDLGGSGGTDCTTPGFGGAGNTHSSRTGFYHLTLINTKARAILPSNTWLQSKVTANMNVNDVCNASWNGSAVSFFRSGSGCSNTGEIAAVFLHEWGHGLDTNTGGAAGENASGEAVGDTFAFLETRDSCIGPNFRPGVTCFNCTSCTGVRDVGDFALGGAATLATPANITSDSGLNCDRFACPYFTPSGFPYRGPMGYQGHCESLIASSANWDLKNALVTEFGESGWQRMDEIWYGSLVPSKSAFQVTSGGQCNASASVDGCGATNWYTVFLAADDDDGNLANGTPNACRIWDAFSAHGIACGARPACTEFGAPDFSLASNAPAQAVCAGGNAQFPIAIGSRNGFANPVTLAVDGVPAGASASFASNPASPGTTTTLDVSGTGAVAAGAYPLLVTGAAADSGGHDLALSLRIDTALAASPAPQAPADGALNVALAPTLSWSAVPGAASYSVEVATDAGFSNIVAQQSGLTGTSWQAPALEPEAAYVWRVTAHNSCGSSAASASFAFTTVALYCRQPNLAIPDNNAAGATDTLVVTRTGTLESLRLRVRANHTWVGDVGFSLSHDGGPQVAVFDRPGVPASTYGCSGDNIDVRLDDDAVDPVETACAASPPAIAGTLRPNALLGPAFAGLDFAGSWSLRATDAFTGDTGTVLEWCLEPTLAATPTFSVGGNVTGLLGGGLALSLNGGAPLPIAGDGSFAFPDALEDGGGYLVTIASQPSAPNQLCEVGGGSGAIAGADAQVDVTCTTLQYTVGALVSGLAGNGLSLSLNGGAPIAVPGNGGIAFPEALDDGAGYAVSVASQPSAPNQLCEVEDGDGALAGADVEVAVTCTTLQYAVGGSVAGLAGSGLVLSLNGGDPLPIAADGDFAFPSPLDDGSGFTVAVQTEPTQPSQDCAVDGGEGAVAGADIDSVAVSCSTPPRAVRGQVSGLLGSGLSVALNGGPALPLDANGPFLFAQSLLEGESYAVTIASQPTAPEQVCGVLAGDGTVGPADVEGIEIACFPIGLFSDDFE